MSNRDRKLRRRVRERMSKTGESYSTARMNLTKRILQEDAAADPAPQQSPRSFRTIHSALVEKGAQPSPTGMREKASAREARVWARLRRELERLGIRETSKTLAVIRKKGLEVDQLEQLARNFATLPSYFFRHLEEAAERLRQIRPALEQAAAIPEAVRQAHELRDLTQELSTSYRAFDDDLREMTRAVNEVGEMTRAANQIGEMTREINQVGEMYREIREAGELYRPLRDALEVTKPLVSAAESVATKLPESVASSIPRALAASRPESVLDRTLDRRLRDSVVTLQSRLDAVAARRRQMERIMPYVPRAGW